MPLSSLDGCKKYMLFKLQKQDEINSRILSVDLKE